MQAAIVLLFAHWVGDYLLQSNEMATQKATSLKWLTIHVGVYCIPVFVASALLFPLRHALTYIAINGALHWVTDLASSRVATRYRSNPRVFHSIVGFDQLFHGACLLATVDLL
jgi:hypothetical protein